MSLERINAQIQEKGFQFEVTEDVIDRGFKTIRTDDGKKVWFKGHNLGDDGVVIYFGDWKTGEKYKAITQGTENLKPRSRKTLNKLDREIAEKRSQKAVESKRQVDKLWEKYKSLQTEENADYLKLKKLTPSDGVFVREAEDDNQKVLIVPLFDESGEMLNFQQLWRRGGKYYKTKAHPKGLYHILDGQTDVVYVGEGFASCRAANIVSGKRVYMAGAVNNLEPVVQIAIKRHGKDKVVILADWDGKTFKKQGHNPGMFKAQGLALKYGVRVTVPVDINDAPLENIDFSDVWLRQGTFKLTTLSYEDLRPHIYKVKKEPKIVSEPIGEVDVSPLLQTDSKKDEQAPAPEKEVIPDYSYIIKPPHRNGWVPDYDEISADIMPDKNKKGGVKNTLNNFQVLMKKVGATLRYNLILNDHEWFIPGEEASTDNYKNVLYGRILDLCARSNFPSTRVDHYLNYFCDKNQFNPVAAWVESKPWDGVSRLEKLYETVKVTEEKTNAERMKMKKTFLRKWMLMALAAAYGPKGIAAPGMLVFQGAQYIGKTKWLLSLVPKELDLAVDGKIVDIRDKDSVKQTVCYWLVELGELDATFKKSDVVALKAFIGRDVDMLRPAYAKHELKLPRRTVFFGSVNLETFLADKTGNRRYWTLPVDDVVWDHGLNMQQIWAELLVEYKKGGEAGQWWLTREEMIWLNESNTQFEVIDTVEERLAQCGDWSADENAGQWLTATEVLMRLGDRSPTNGEAQKCSTAIKKLNGGRKKMGPGGRTRLLWVPKFD